MSMTAVLFTKPFGDRPAETIAEAVTELGFDGVDLLIRPGFLVTPDNPAMIGRTVATLARNGVPVPIATTDLTDPAAFPVDAVLGACVEAGIRSVRLGYWRYDGSRPYRDVFDEARRQLDALESIAARFGVTLTLQLHGGTIHSSGALALRLLAGRNPDQIGAYVDPGNQVVQDGHEGWRLTFDLLQPWLRCVGVKNGGWAPAGLHPSGQRLWTADWLGVPDGCAPWHEIVAYLVESGYAGPLSFHSHYEVPLPQVLDQTRTDLRFIRRLALPEAALRAMPGSPG
ncbi:MAG TPA: sugar phosphate isomerase/epimerase [Natronosporangium sp.]